MRAPWLRTRYGGGWWPVAEASSGAVGVTSVVDVEDVDDALRVVDGVADAIFTAPGSPLSLEGLPQRSANPPRLLAKRTANELQARPGDGFGEPFG